MYFTASSRRSFVGFLVAFLLCGLGHIVLYGVPFTFCFSQLFCGSFTLLWALSIQKRVTDNRIRQLLLGVAFFLMLYYTLQIARYRLLSPDAPAFHYCWYAYYVPMLMVPLLAFYLSLFIHRPPEARLPRISHLALLITAVLFAGLFTNDRYHLFFRFRTEYPDDAAIASRGTFFYLYFAFFISLLLIAFFIILRKMRLSGYGRYRYIPVIPPVLEGIYLLLNLLRLQPAIHGIPIWQMGETFGFFMLAFLESCLQLGMIPVNQDYEKFFALMESAAVIRDQSGTAIYRTAGAAAGFPPPGTETILQAHPIRGGSLAWSVDLAHLSRLNAELAEASQQMGTRNAYLQKENEIQKEKAEFTLRNRLYDEVRTAVSPQLSRISAFLQKDPSPPDLQAALPAIAVTGAYIKRRSNMELMGESGSLPVEELFTALAESLQYLELAGVKTVLSPFGNGEYDASLVKTAYEDFGRLVEAALPALTGLVLTVRAEKARLTLRYLLTAPGMTVTALFPEETAGLRQLSYETDGPDTHLVFSYPARPAEAPKGGVSS